MFILGTDKVYIYFWSLV